MKHPLLQYLPSVDDAPPNHWYWDSLGHEYGPWHRLHRLGDLVTQSRRRFIYYKRCDEAVKDRLAMLNAQAVQDQQDAIDLARKRHPRGNRQVAAKQHLDELFADAGKVVERARGEVDAIVAEHLETLSPKQKAVNEATFDEYIENERFDAAHAKFRQGQPLKVPHFLRRSTKPRLLH